MAKNVNTMVVRDNTAVNGVEIIFSQKASGDVRKKLNGKYHKVTGYQSLTFRWNNAKGLWYATNCKSLKKQLDKLIKELTENGYIDDDKNSPTCGKKITVKVIDERTVEPTAETAPTTTRRRSGRGYRRNYRQNTAPTKTPVQTETVAELETVQTQTVAQSTGYTKYDVQMRALELVASIVEMNR